MYEELAEDCQRGDNAMKKQVHQEVQKITKVFLINFRDFCASWWLERGVGLKFFEALDSNTTTAQLDDAATFEIVEYGGSSLTCCADETRNVLVSEWHDVISGSAFEFSRARRQLVH